MSSLCGAPWNTEHLLYDMVPRSVRPNLVNDVTADMEEWESIARCHESQMSLRDGKVLEGLRRFRESYGALIGVAYAEAFFDEEPIVFDLAHFMTTSSQPGAVPSRGASAGVP